MIRVRRSNERGGADHGWLKTKHSFSFADYYNPEFMGFGPLRVINEDYVAPGTGFGKHPHRDMEIITYVITGAVAHEDSMGNRETVNAGDLQRMSAGTGVFHSEFNPSDEEMLHLLQIWIEPAKRGIAPSYEQKTQAELSKRNVLQRVVSPTPATNELTIHQNAELYLAKLDQGTSVTHSMQAGRIGWIQLVDGELDLNGAHLSAGDGAAIENESSLKLTATSSAHFVLFDMAA